jgi:predicted RNA methylase
MASPAAFAAERVGAITNCLGSVGTTLLPTAINAGLGVFGLALLYVGAKTIIGAPPDPIKKLVG